jgi:hypothetical protein
MDTPVHGVVSTPVTPAAELEQQTENADAFFESLVLPIHDALVPDAPRRRAARTQPASFVPRRSDRLTAKAVFRDPNLELQAKRVLVNKWERQPDDAARDVPDDRIMAKFHETFSEPLSSDTREAMRELWFPRGGARRRAIATRLFQ